MKLKTHILTITACSLLALSSLSAQETLVYYNFGDDDASPTTTASPKTINSTLLSNATAFSYPKSGAGISSGATIDLLKRPNLYSFVTTAAGVNIVGESNAATFSITLTPIAGQSIDFGTFSFNIGYQNNSSTTHPAYTIHYGLKVTIDGVTEIMPETYTYDVAASSTGRSAIDGLATFNLDAYKDISSSITFSIVVYATATEGSFNDQQTIRIDNVTVTTAAPIPEPTTIAILMGSFVMLVTYVWRWRKN